MTSVELAMRLCRWLTVKDLAMLPADGRVDVLNAMNAGLQRFYELAPAPYKLTAFAGVLPAPRRVTVSVTKGSAVFGGYVAVAGDKGCTIQIDGDQLENEITASNGLLDVYQGETGARGATIYGDVLRVDSVIRRFIDDPALENGAILTKEDGYRRWGGFCWPPGMKFGRRRTHRRVGMPRHYWLESVGQSQGGRPAFLLRVDALPDRDYRLRINGELAPRKLRFGDLQTPVELPIEDSFVESKLLPLCAAALTDSPLWENNKILSRIDSRAGQAAADIALISPTIDVPRNRVFTPKGW
ncbi:MAG: hypothetical protein LBK60_06325 [Verrucomicrobiales bacterium]|jgi:hypothetical protein|nr:hypothetical protein [Verrucomicrobiales bacterium]